MSRVGFKDHFSAVATTYASARPEYPDALFAWIASIAPARAQVWEAGCGSGQASRGLAVHFDRVFATDPSTAQIAQATGAANITFAVQPGERCSLPDASVDAVCVAQALHWFDRGAFFVECARLLRPGGVLVAWGYQDIEVPAPLAPANRALQDEIHDYWPPERAWIDDAYGGARLVRDGGAREESPRLRRGELADWGSALDEMHASFPKRSIGRLQGASFPSEMCVRTSL